MSRNFGLLLAVLSFFAATVALSQPRSGRRGPPEAAVIACQGRAVEDACGFRFRDREISGRCLVVPRRRDRGLVCVPDRLRRRPPKHRGPRR